MQRLMSKGASPGRVYYGYLASVYALAVQLPCSTCHFKVSELCVLKCLVRELQP